MNRVSRISTAVWLLWLTVGAPAQTTLNPPASNPQLTLERLANTGAVLLIAAHPDDESNDLLAYLALGRRLRTGYLSLTRGEGGQNVIGSEQGALLGTIRTQELLAARRIDGAEQFFTSAIDFGYSKTAEETLQKWNREKILGEIVRCIRDFQPDIVILRWTGTSADGHGHHQASAILGREAFDAAADPKKFPGILKPWRAKRLMTFSNGKAEIALPVGSYDPLLGYSYTEIGGIARSQHHSQGMGAPQRAGAAFVYLKNTGGDVATGDLMDGVANKWSADVQKLFAAASAAYSPARPEQSIPALLAVRKALEGSGTEFARRKLRDLDEFIALCAGLKVTVLADTPQAPVAPPIHVEAINRSAIPVEFNNESLPANVLVDRKLPPPTVGSVELPFTVARSTIRLMRPVVYRYVDKVLGERTQPFTIVPAVGVNFTESTLLFPSDAPRDVTVTVVSFSGPAKGTVSLRLPPGWSSNPPEAPFDLPKQNASAPISFRITPASSPISSEVSASVRGSTTSGASVIVIRYPHIPTQTVVQPATARFVRENIRMLAHKVGYIMGAGDEVPDAIRQLGCTVTFLSAADLTSGDLNEYDAIVTGVRAFNLREDLRASMGRLNEYVRAGGSLIVQYNLTDNTGPLGPFPITLGRNRIAVEEAPVRVLNSTNPVMRFPNPITANDFAGWVQERGLYFPSAWDPKYQTPVESADPGESPLRGGILFTRYGEGAYVYTSYSWFRQLPAGVPGAYRIFANMLSQ
jgi:LmbE family N-acetylglucosaminyl deacetylase